jgi:MoxR-like ATPase
MSYLSEIKDACLKWDSSKWSEVIEDSEKLDKLFPALALLAIRFPGELSEMRAILQKKVGEIAAGLRINADGNEDVVVYLDNKHFADGNQPLLGIYTPPSRRDDLGFIRTAIKEKTRGRWRNDKTLNIPVAAIALALSKDLFDYDSKAFTDDENRVYDELFFISGTMRDSLNALAYHADFDSNVAKRGGYMPTKMITDHDIGIFKLSADKKYAKAEKVAIDFDAARSEGLFERSESDFSEEEKLLIPGENPSHVYVEAEKIITDEIIRTSTKKIASQRLRNILVSGDPGCGKSELSSTIAFIFRRPKVVQTLSGNTSEDELLGTLMPVVDGEVEASLPLDDTEKKIYAALKSAANKDRFSIIDAVADVIGLPTLASCYLSPEAAADELGGEATNASEAAALLDTTVGAKIASVVAKVKSAAKGSEGVQYQYIKSSIVDAVENGYILEIQEPTNVAQQSVFSCLYDVLERSSTGILQTPLGPVKRHPDFMCIATTNHHCAGNKPLSEAFSSRFQMKLDMDAPTEMELVSRVLAKTEKSLTETGTATDIVKVYQQAINACKEIGTRTKPTPRELYMFADAIFDGLDPHLAFKLYILSACSHENDERAELLDAVEDLPLMRKKAAV